MSDLDVEGLALALKEYLHPDIVKMLKDQQVSESTFLGLNLATLKLFGFPMGHIVAITSLISDLKGGTKVLKPPQLTDNSVQASFSSRGSRCETSGSSSSIPTDGNNLFLDDDEQEQDRILSEFIKEDYLKTLSAYVKTSLCGKVKRWQNLKAMNSPHAHAPDLSVPCMYLKDLSVAPSSDAKKKAGPRKKTGATKRQSQASDTSDDHSNVDHSFESTTTLNENSDETRDNVNSDDDNRDEDRLQNKVTYIEAPALQKTSEELKAMSPSLPQYDIETVLLDDENSKERTKHYVNILRDGKLLGSKERKRMLRKLGNHLCFKIVDDPSKATAAMREGLAKSIVVTCPQYQKTIEIPGTTPWSHMWNTKGGHLSNVIKRIQTNLPDSKRARKGKKPKRKKKKKMPTSTVDIVQLGLLLPNEANRLEIFDGMKKTYEIRCAMRDKGTSVTALIKDFEQFIHFDGELIELEFKTMHPNAKDMCPELAKYVPKIIQKWDDLQPITKFPDDNMKALLILASKLPHTINSRSSKPVEEEILVMTKTGVSVQDFTEEWRQKKKTAVQPYILAIMSQMRNEVLKYYIILEGYHLDVGNIPFLRCVDWLFKCYFVFDVKYPKTWTQFFRFLQTVFYKISYSGKIDIPPSSLELFNAMKAL